MTNHQQEYEELAKYLNTSVAPVFEQLSESMAIWQQAFEPLGRELRRISEALASIFEVIAPVAEAFARYCRFIDSVEASGWLPYHTITIAYVEESGDDTRSLDNRLSEYYKTNWASIRNDMESRLAFYSIPDQVRLTFREALEAHQLGHYRCVCRVLFPEIEDLIRHRYFNGAAGNITSSDMLRKLTSDKVLDDFMPREAYGLILFGRLIDHVYKPVTNLNRAHYEKHFVPNRHAALHGLVPYATHKHSINMIVFTDYIFQIFSLTGKQ